MEKIELVISWSEFEPIATRIDAIENRQDEITNNRKWYENKQLSDEWHNLSREKFSLKDKYEYMRPRLIPEVGMPCTVIYYSDRSAGTIINVPSPKTIVVQQDGLYHGRKVFTYRRNGHWVEKGTTSKDWGTLCALGYRSDYYDMEY